MLVEKVLSYLSAQFPRYLRELEQLVNVDSGSYYKPGVSDMKSGLLSALYAVEALKAAGYDGFGRITFLCTADEEIGSRALKPIIQSLCWDSDVALVVESARSNGAIVSARKGTGVFQITAVGRAAHAGVEPENGANAVVALAHQVIALHELNGLAPGVTINVGTIKGGDRTNVVPPHAVAGVDLRYSTAEDGAQAERAIRGLADCTIVRGTEIQVTGSLRRPPMEKTEQVARLVEFAQQAASQVGIQLAQ